MRIRDLAPDEHDAAIALWHAAGLTRPWNDPRSDLDRALAGPSSTVLAAVSDDDGLLGTVMVGHDGHRGWMYYLAAAVRGRGVGRALVAAAEDRLAAHVPKVQLMVRADNEAAAAFYGRLGYARSDVTVWQRVIPDDPARPGSPTLLGSRE
ncbi:GNAT family acetyltransferase [Actinomycetospora soli]|uniref:GNAT family acetyltransferase n=1 Tax=Actinomycetospora soli TaxID=2893887 RepID=UPI001E5732A2|nr:GNAT family acetyltransferase [Actinomycetospora soli]MCD2188676.1 GNAT family acetyltransferase [Actinomycetospora soli]